MQNSDNVKSNEEIDNDNELDQPVITGETLIADLVESFPLVVDFLVEEYGFYCFNCFLSSYESLEEGAKVHGIEGDNFQELLENVNKLIRGELDLYK
jgi:hybrid cluster-associated redox disulfide protein